MTDTTDIASLMLKMRTLADRIIDAEGENNNGEVGQIIEMYDAADTTFKAQNILLVLSAFEEQRQRADALQTERGEFRRRLKLERSILEDADKELAELKGDQVPVGWRFEDCENEPCTNGAVVSVGTGSDNIHLCAECSRNDKYKRQRTVALSQRLSLKVTAPQKLSNLPYDVLFNAIGKAVNIQGEALSISVKAFKEAIEAAGGIVKDGE